MAILADPDLREQDIMAETAGQQRIEAKVDTLIESVNNMGRQVQSVADQQNSDRKMQDRMNEFYQQAITRLQGELDEATARLTVALNDERAYREKDDASIRNSLGKVGYALFTSLLILIASILAYVLTHPHP